MSPRSYFRSSGYLSDSVIETGSGESIDLSKLPSFLRTLMVMDGTVTKSLAAWFWEPVTIDARFNQLSIATSSIVGLEDLAEGDPILQREVILQGSNTKTLFACARSVVSLKHLPKNISEALEKGKIGIGELLRENDVETYRDIFSINYFSEVDKNDQLLLKMKGEIISRSYRIRVKGIPAIIVTEYFPVDLYK